MVGDSSTWHRVARWPAALGGLVLVAALMSAPPAQGQAEPDPAAPEAPAAVAGAVVHALDTLGVRRYWTADRMRSAVPLGLDPAGDRIASRGPAASDRSARAGLVAPRSTGKLFFTTPQGDAVCSAAAINTPAQNAIITAAHCAHSGTPKACGLLQTCSGYFTNFLFVPRYTNGAGPDGSWVGTSAVTHRQWMESEDLSFDQALIQVAPRNGRSLVSVVGGNGLAWNYPPRENGVRVWGWAAEAPYDGETVETCAGNTTSFDDSNDAQIQCPLTGGASGGPWFLTMLTADVGFIWAVTSRRTLSDPPYLLAQPLSSAITTLLAATAGAEANPRVAERSKPRQRHRRLRLVAAPSRVGRGQVIVLRTQAKPGSRTVLRVRYKARGKWRKVTVQRAGSDGVARFVVRATRTGKIRYQVRQVKRPRTTSKTRRVRVTSCPLPLDRRASVVDATACTSPVG